MFVSPSCDYRRRHLLLHSNPFAINLRRPPLQEELAASKIEIGGAAHCAASSEEGTSCDVRRIFVVLIIIASTAIVQIKPKKMTSDEAD